MKPLVKAWLPPAIVSLYREWKKSADYEGNYASWQEALAHSTGYDSALILEKVLEATLKVKCGEAAFERDSVLFDEIEYAWPVLAGLMWVAARNGGRLNVLDFGGALGSSYFQNRKFLLALPEVHWNVVEQAHYVDAGRAHIQDEQLRFYKTIEECITENQPNVILLSSVLQYLERPYDLLDKLGNLNVKHIIVDRTPFVDGEEDILVIQRVPKWIFPATLPAWLFSEESFDCAMNRSGYVRVASIPCEDGGGERFKLRGFLYRRGEL